MSALTVFPLYANSGCTDRQLNCNDPNSVLIYTLLSLANPNGSTLYEIAQRIPFVCPYVSWTTQELNTNLRVAFKRGIITTVHPNTFAVNAGMVRVNPSNKKYFCICQLFKS
jgi:hypothetical protein